MMSEARKYNPTHLEKKIDTYRYYKFEVKKQKLNNFGKR